MAICEVVPATLGHIKDVAAHVRKEDRQEVWASHLMNISDMLHIAVSHSDIAMAFILDGKAACLFGVQAASMLGSGGTIWLIGTDTLSDPKAVLPFLRHCKRHVMELLRCYGTLGNYVDARYTKSIRWLEWLGFEMESARPYGALGLPFHRFTMGRVEICVD